MRIALGNSQDRRSTPIVAHFLPIATAEPDGLADYSCALAESLWEQKRVESIFVSARPSTVMRHRWRTVTLARHSSRSLFQDLCSLSAEAAPQAVILHYCGYGYHKRGVPWWLSTGLKMWKEHDASVPLLTVFHELYAINPRPWNSSYWLLPLQRHIVRILLQLSAAVITPLELYKRCLIDLNGGKDGKITCMPVFSNVGHPGRGSPPEARASTGIVFGLAGVENRIFKKYGPKLERLIELLGIDEIIDIGPRSSSVPRTIGRARVISKGALARGAVSDILQHSKFGFVAYPMGYLGQSGVFAAYAAHGIVPVVLSESTESFDGLKSKQHFIDGLRFSTDDTADDLSGIQRDLCRWYRSHSLEVQGHCVGQLLESIARERRGRTDAL